MLQIDNFSNKTKKKTFQNYINNDFESKHQLEFVQIERTEESRHTSFAKILKIYNEF